MSGFISADDITTKQADVQYQLQNLTHQSVSLPPLTRGSYVMEESDLADEIRELLHGRAFVINNESLYGTSETNIWTYYIAADKGQGLIVPARILLIESKDGTIAYRWTDDGEKWTSWITLDAGVTEDYVNTKNRFAEVQVYALTGNPSVTIVASR